MEAIGHEAETALPKKTGLPLICAIKLEGV
jgi:hypothetical protein